MCPCAGLRHTWVLPRGAQKGHHHSLVMEEAEAQRGQLASGRASNHQPSKLPCGKAQEDPQEVTGQAVGRRPAFTQMHILGPVDFHGVCLPTGPPYLADEQRETHVITGSNNPTRVILRPLCKVLVHSRP